MRTSDEEIKRTIDFLQRKGRSDHSQRRLEFWKRLLEQRTARSVVTEEVVKVEQLELLEV